MNLWVNHVRQLAVLAVALFFFGCQDETSILGYKNQNSKFNVSYVEIPLESSVVVLDSVETSNIHYYNTTDFKRVLAGRFQDPNFGDVSATSFLQFRPVTSVPVSSTAQLDSATLYLHFDYYVNGVDDISKQSFTIHELTESFVIENYSNYFNNSLLAYNPTPIGANSYELNTTLFKDEYKKTSPDTTIIRFTLDPSFSGRLFDVVKNNIDSALSKPKIFLEKFKGLSVVPANNNKIVGFNPGSLSRITLHYHDDNNDSLAVNFTFVEAAGFFVGNFSNISADRSITPQLNSLVTKYSDFYPSDDKRYIQAGTGIVTKVDMTKFYEFALADSNQNIVINSASLEITGINNPTYLDPPYQLALLVLKNNLRQNFFAARQDSLDYVSYSGFLSGYDTYGVAASETRTQFAPLVYLSGENKYSSILTLFFQQMLGRRTDENRYINFALLPHSTRPSTSAIRYEAGKSVNGAVFNKDNIKLKVTYTKPTVNPNQ